MSRKTDLWWTLAALAAFAFSFGLSRLFVPAHAKVTPFTVTTECYTSRVLPTDVPVSREITAVRQNGAQASLRVKRNKLGALGGYPLRTISLPNGLAVAIYPELRVKTTWERSRQQNKEFAAEMIARLLNPPSNCTIPGLRLVDNEVVQGWVASRIDDVFPPPNNISATKWLAPSLGCLELASKAYDAQPDGTFAVSQDCRLVSVKMGEPDPALFDVPSNYEEVRPSEVERRFAERHNFPFPFDEGQKRSLEDQDRAYLLGPDSLRPNGRNWRDQTPSP